MLIKLIAGRKLSQNEILDWWSFQLYKLNERILTIHVSQSSPLLSPKIKDQSRISTYLRLYPSGHWFSYVGSIIVGTIIVEGVFVLVRPRAFRSSVCYSLTTVQIYTAFYAYLNLRLWINFFLLHMHAWHIIILLLVLLQKIIKFWDFFTF